MTDINVPPRDFKVGDDVVCLNFGIGQVTSNTSLYGFPIKVKFGNTKEAYTASGQFVPHGKRCLFHADENVKVTVTALVYEYQILYKLKEYEAWTMSSFHYKTIEEFEGDLNQFEGDLNQYESIELFLPSKRLVQND